MNTGNRGGVPQYSFGLRPAALGLTWGLGAIEDRVKNRDDDHSQDSGETEAEGDGDSQGNEECIGE